MCWPSHATRGRHDYEDPLTRSVDYQTGPLKVSVAGLDDMISSKEVPTTTRTANACPS